MCESAPALEWRRTSTGEVMSYRCNSWRCPDCAPGVVAMTRRQLNKWATDKDLRRFFTLTLEPRTISPEQLEKVANPRAAQAVAFRTYNNRIAAGDTEEQAQELAKLAAWYERRKYCHWLLTACSGTPRANERKQFARGTEKQQWALRGLLMRYLSYVWNKFRTALKRKFGNFSYVQFRELHADNVRPHIHMMVSRFIPVQWIIQHFPRYGGGKRVDVSYIQGEDVNRVYHYVTKYLAKVTQTPADKWPRGIRRVVTSRDICMRMNPEDFKHYKQWERFIKCMALPSDDSPCMLGHTPEALDGCDYEQCERCPMRKARKCKPIGYPWRWELYDTEAGRWYSKRVHDYVTIHNEWTDARPRELWKRVPRMIHEQGKKPRLEYGWELLPQFVNDDMLPASIRTPSMTEVYHV